MTNKEFNEFALIVADTEYENELINKAVEYINKLHQELTNLKAIEKEHQRTNGELREENKELKHIIDELEEWLNDLGDWVVLEKLQELKGESNERS